MNWIVTGSLMGLAGVGLGAFGAHGLDVGPEQLEWWKTGALYHLLHAPVIVLCGMLERDRGSGATPAWLFASGSVVFAGTLYALALGAPRWFGAITPLGGVLLMAGWLALAIQARAPRSGAH